MSGGHYDYKSFKVMELCDEMDHEIANFRNPEKGDWSPGYTKEHLDMRQKFVDHMRKVAEIAHTIEWVDSGDHSEEREIRELTEFFKLLKD
jgi:hypothetical protein